MVLLGGNKNPPPALVEIPFVLDGLLKKKWEKTSKIIPMFWSQKWQLNFVQLHYHHEMPHLDSKMSFFVDLSPTTMIFRLKDRCVAPSILIISRIYTVCKSKNLSPGHILREINFGRFGVFKTCHLGSSIGS